MYLHSFDQGGSDISHKNSTNQTKLIQSWKKQISNFKSYRKKGDHLLVVQAFNGTDIGTYNGNLWCGVCPFPKQWLPHGYLLVWESWSIPLHLLAIKALTLNVVRVTIHLQTLVYLKKWSFLVIWNQSMRYALSEQPSNHIKPYNHESKQILARNVIFFIIAS